MIKRSGDNARRALGRFCSCVAIFDHMPIMSHGRHYCHLLIPSEKGLGEPDTLDHGAT